MNDIISLLNHYFSVFWVVVLIGLIHILIRERQPLMAFWRGRQLGKSGGPAFNKARPRILRRAMYFIGGCLMVLSAWTITISILRFYVGLNFDFSDPLSMPNMFTPLRDLAGSISLLGVSGFITAGTCFTLSAGDRWLVTMGKIFTSLTIVGLGWMFVLASLG